MIEPEKMIQTAAEERFVRTYIRRERRDRLLYELTNPKKRNRGLERFCHRAAELLDPGKIRLKGENLTRLPEFGIFVREQDGSCLLLSPDAALDGRMLPFREALDAAVFWPDAVILIGEGFAVVFEEPEKTGREQYLLTEKK